MNREIVTTTVFNVTGQEHEHSVDQPAELFERQRRISLDMPQAVTIIGVGGVGFWAALLAAMSGIEQIFLMDYDRLEASNLNRLPFSIEAVGQLKTEATRIFIETLRPRCFVDIQGEYSIVALSLTQGTVIDCTDRRALQAKICSDCKATDRDYIRAGYDGTQISVTSHPQVWSTTTEEEPDGYEVTPSWAVPAIIVAALALAKLMYNGHIEVNNNIDQVFVEGAITPIITRSVLSEIIDAVHDCVSAYCNHCDEEIEVELDTISFIRALKRILEGEGINVEEN